MFYTRGAIKRRVYAVCNGHSEREIGVFDNDEKGVGDLFFSFFLLIGGGDFVCKLEKFWKRNSQVWLVRFRFLFNFGFINLIGCNCSMRCRVVGWKSNCKIGLIRM